MSTPEIRQRTVEARPPQNYSSLPNPAQLTSTRTPSRPTPPRPIHGSELSEIRATRDLDADFVHLASKLSDRLASIEKQLSGRPATVHAEVPFEYDGAPHNLTWTRMNGTWRLFVFEIPNAEEQRSQREVDGSTPIGIKGRPLTQCSVDLKIAAAEGLPELIFQIQESEKATVDRLRGILARLDQISIGGKEGA